MSQKPKNSHSPKNSKLHLYRRSPRRYASPSPPRQYCGLSPPRRYAAPRRSVPDSSLPRHHAGSRSPRRYSYESLPYNREQYLSRSPKKLYPDQNPPVLLSVSSPPRPYSITTVHRRYCGPSPPRQCAGPSQPNVYADQFLRKYRGQSPPRRYPSPPRAYSGPISPRQHSLRLSPRRRHQHTLSLPQSFICHSPQKQYSNQLIRHLSKSPPRRYLVPCQTNSPVSTSPVRQDEGFDSGMVSLDQSPSKNCQEQTPQSPSDPGSSSFCGLHYGPAPRRSPTPSFPSSSSQNADQRLQSQNDCNQIEKMVKQALESDLRKRKLEESMPNYEDIPTPSRLRVPLSMWQEKVSPAKRHYSSSFDRHVIEQKECNESLPNSPRSPLKKRLSLNTRSVQERSGLDLDCSSNLVVTRRYDPRKKCRYHWPSKSNDSQKHNNDKSKYSRWAPEELKVPRWHKRKTQEKLMKIKKRKQENARKLSNGEKRRSFENPKHNHSTAVGLEYVVAATGHYCQVCCNFFMGGDSVIQLHCKTATHHEKLKAQLNEEKRRLKRVKKREMVNFVISDRVKKLHKSNEDGNVGDSETQSTSEKAMNGEKTGEVTDNEDLNKSESQLQIVCECGEDDVNVEKAESDLVVKEEVNGDERAESDLVVKDEINGGVDENCEKSSKTEELIVVKEEINGDVDENCEKPSKTEELIGVAAENV